MEALGLQGVELLAHADNGGGGSRGGGGVTRIPAAAALAGKTLALYFSAHWCPPCRAFTPILADTYERVRQKHDDFEVVFVSADRNTAQFQEYFQHMPWLALPFEEQALRQRLSNKLGVMGIPRLVIVGADGEVVASDARGAVMADRAGDNYPWRGAAGGGGGLAGLLGSPQGLLLLFLILYWLSQWFTSKP